MSFDAETLQAMTPQEIDTVMAEVWEEIYTQRRYLAGAWNSVHNDVHDKKKYLNRSQFRWLTSDEDALAKAKAVLADENATAWRKRDVQGSLDRLKKYQDKLAELTTQDDLYAVEFARRSGWTRAFVVRGNDGHIHSSTHCHTCRPTTQFGWLPEYSGKDEAEIVEAAGMMACTVCYPSAPVAKKIPSKIKKMPKI